MSCRPNVLLAECLSVKDPVGQTSVGLVSVGQMSVGQTSGHGCYEGMFLRHNELQPKCLSVRT